MQRVLRTKRYLFFKSFVLNPSLFSNSIEGLTNTFVCLVTIKAEHSLYSLMAFLSCLIKIWIVMGNNNGSIQQHYDAQPYDVQFARFVSFLRLSFDLLLAVRTLFRLTSHKSRSTFILRDLRWFEKRETNIRKTKNPLLFIRIL